jgi:hypothetical protein
MPEGASEDEPPVVPLEGDGQMDDATLTAAPFHDEPPPVTIEEARVAVAALLTRAGLQRVVCVDDDFAGEVADLTSACELLDPGEARLLPHLGDIDFDAPPEAWKQEVELRWQELSPSDQGLVLADARQRAAMLEPGEEINAGALKAVLGDGVEFFALTPEGWQDRRAELIAQAATIPTLVLFDMDLGEGVSGLQLAIALYDKDPNDRTWAGVFTHTVAAEDEGERWEALAATPGIRRDRFVLLSKQHLANPSTLPHAIKLTLISRPASELRRHVASAIAASVDDALAELNQLSAPEFERIVFRSSQEEGLWEPDNLLRLFDACLRNGVRNRLHTSEDVRALADRLRALSAVPSTPTLPSDLARRIYRRELYDVPDHLNKVHLPVELGDVFENDGDAFFVVVDQPCDLMVRSNGRRAPDRQFIVVVQISFDEAWAKRSDAFELPAFSEDGQPAWAMLSRPRMVPVEALDYCVFDDDGRGLAPVLGQPPVWLWPSWRTRHELLARHAAQVKSAVDGAPDPLKQRLGESFYGIQRSTPFKLVVTEERLRFRVRRVRRLLAPYTRALLSRYSAQLARDAFERPFA